jgi:hypothetical protein
MPQLQMIPCGIFLVRSLGMRHSLLRLICCSPAEMYLSPDELEKCAYVVNIDNQLFGTDPSVKLSADINALDLITLGSSFSKSRMTFLYAKTGRKIELQEYATILTTCVVC